LRQSSSVSFHAFSGSSRRFSKRSSCSFEEMCSQNLTKTTPSSVPADAWGET